MPVLASELRNGLERLIIEARDAAEAGARVALEALAVHNNGPYAHMKPAQRSLRNHLRARARQLGDRQDAIGRLPIDHLVSECAYEYWHRMLFARFLAENGLLIEPQEKIAISLAEAEELAKESGENVWVFASRCAQGMLPQIFRPDDPMLQVPFAAEHMVRLERLLASLSPAVFTASDALGWVYQFWQSKKKDEVNRSEVKIGADEIAAVTQLFTEPYMVEFILHNTLGAWWAGKYLAALDAASAKGEDELRRKLALPGVGWQYLRFIRGADGKGGPWQPAAGTLDNWPTTTAKLRILDPCCGSGHFLVAALYHLVPMRMAEEGLSAAEAVDAVLRHNIYGLEIDDRCCQIAAFALAFAAWTYKGAGGYRQLPEVHIACTGVGPQAAEEQWIKLAEQSGMPTSKDEQARITNGLLNLHRLFSQAPMFGSLIDPAELPSDLYMAGYEKIQPYLAAVLSVEKADDETRELAIAAAGMVRAAAFLAGEYSLVVTNVPYLGRGKQTETLRVHLEEHYNAGKADLATAFVIRCLKFCGAGGSIGLVTPQNWLFLTTYTKLRETLLEQYKWDFIARLGPKAFQTPMWDFNVQLAIITAMMPIPSHMMAGIDVSAAKKPNEKAALLRGELNDKIDLVSQADQLDNPDARIQFTTVSAESLLGNYADSYQGIGTSDNAQFLLYFWELPTLPSDYRFVQVAPEQTTIVSGANHILHWESGKGRYYGHAMRLKSEGRLGGWKSGGEAWDKTGVAVSVTGKPNFCRYLGSMFDTTMAAIIPKSPDHLQAIEVFMHSNGYIDLVRAADQALSLTEHSFLKVPFDFDYWQKVAAEKYPNGLPGLESDDPTQWLFHGWPKESTATLQVAVARLLGYRWAAELDGTMQLSSRGRALAKKCEELFNFADADGVLCIPPVRGEESAEERLIALLAASGVTPAEARKLAGETDLDDWLHNSFFEDHCKLFHDRPFIWHIWDGRKRDGFHVLVNENLCSMPRGLPRG